MTSEDIQLERNTSHTCSTTRPIQSI